MPKAEWGVKRTCPSCEARFYDLQRDPIVCPECGATFAVDDHGKVLATRERRVPVAVPDENDEALVDDEDLSEEDADAEDLLEDEDDDEEAAGPALAEEDDADEAAVGFDDNGLIEDEDEDEIDDDEEDLDDLDDVGGKDKGS
jgi:uncharacterized protein (TIGR02300 family)